MNTLRAEPGLRLVRKWLRRLLPGGRVQQHPGQHELQHLQLQQKVRVVPARARRQAGLPSEAQRRGWEVQREEDRFLHRLQCARRILRGASRAPPRAWPRVGRGRSMARAENVQVARSPTHRIKSRAECHFAIPRRQRRIPYAVTTQLDTAAIATPPMDG